LALANGNVIVRPLPLPQVHVYETTAASSLDVVASTVQVKSSHTTVNRDTGAWLTGTGAVTVNATVDVPVSPCASRAVSVITCAPTLSVLIANDAPVPIAPLMLLLQVSDAPVSAPSSGSVPVPANATDVPWTTEEPAAGAVMAADGA